MLWLKSRNSEVWLERRTGYTRSSAVMSMVGYLLGLGDRHPSNLMLDRYSGKLLHIDFGDCFEVSCVLITALSAVEGAAYPLQAQKLWYEHGGVPAGPGGPPPL